MNTSRASRTKLTYEDFLVFPDDGRRHELIDGEQPDLMVVLANQLDILTEKNVQGAPALLVEILSPRTSRRDQGIKLKLYERVGVREYWVVDPDRDVIDVFGRDDNRGFRSRGTLTAQANDALTTPLLPGFSLPLADLFQRDSRV